MNKRSKMMNDFFNRKEELLRQKEQSDKIKRENFIKNVFDQASIEERYRELPTTKVMGFRFQQNALT